jgi:hypothetical protein
VGIRRVDRLSAGGLKGCQHHQGAEQLGGVAGVHADLGEDAPGLERGEAVLNGGAFGADELVDLFLGGGERAAAGGLAAGDDDRVLGVIVQSGEAEVGDGCSSSVVSWPVRR